VVEWHVKVIFYLLTSPKLDFGEFEKAMFQVVARHLEHVFFLLTSPKCDLGEVEKAMFQGLAGQFELIFGLLTIPKYDLVEIKGSHGNFKLFSAPGPTTNATWEKYKNNFFNGCKALRTLFLALDHAKMPFG